MPGGQVLEFSAVTKRFGAITAVDGFSAQIQPGLVTGFLGPNGAGKTTSLRILLGLVNPTSGTATIGGVAYPALKHPLQTVGAALEASSFHPGRTGADHLRVYAKAAGLPASRVDEALGLVGLADAAGRKAGGYSLGMRQRLGLAYALLGDPGVLVLDEPANGLDPEGIKWMRGLLRELARQGRTVLVSSHLLAEVQQTVDSLLIISQGRLVFQGGLDDLTDPSEFATVVDAPDRAALSDALRAADVEFEVLRSGLTVRGVDAAVVGQAAATAGVALSALQRRGPALEEVFLDLVNGVRVHASAAGPTTEPEPEPAPEATPVADAEAQPVTETEPVSEAEPVTETEPEPDAEAEETADESPVPAGFVVASTGVIDIVSDAAPEDVESGGTDAEHPAEDAESTPVVETDIDELEREPDLAPMADERPWEDASKTEADLEADAFFSSFDARERAEAAAAEAQAAADAEGSPASDEAPEDEAVAEEEAADDASTGSATEDAHEGESAREDEATEEGEQR